jgi:hypothetical protein
VQALAAPPSRTQEKVAASLLEKAILIVRIEVGELEGVTAPSVKTGAVVSMVQLWVASAPVFPAVSTA